jgi:alpha-galactosidase
MMIPQRSLAATLLLALVLAPKRCRGYNNGLGRLPALGWNGWCTDGPCQRDVCYETTVLEIADAMVSSGMRELGWEYVNLDDCWGSTERAADGSLQANATRFPSGIKALAAAIHSKGLKLGMYTASGTTWCMHPWMEDGDRHIPGMWGHYAQDVATLVSWDIDYLKLDWCAGSPMPDGTELNPFNVYPNVSKMLNESQRHIWFSACAGYAHPAYVGGPQKPGVIEAAASVQSWRTGADHHDVWNETAKAIASMAGKSNVSGP